MSSRHSRSHLRPKQPCIPAGAVGLPTSPRHFLDADPSRTIASGHPRPEPVRTLLSPALAASLQQQPRADARYHAAAPRPLLSARRHRRDWSDASESELLCPNFSSSSLLLSLSDSGSRSSTSSFEEFRQTTLSCCPCRCHCGGEGARMSASAVDVHTHSQTQASREGPGVLESREAGHVVASSGTENARKDGVAATSSSSSSISNCFGLLGCFKQDAGPAAAKKKREKAQRRASARAEAREQASRDVHWSEL